MKDLWKYEGINTKKFILFLLIMFIIVVFIIYLLEPRLLPQFTEDNIRRIPIIIKEEGDKLSWKLIL